MTIYIVVLTYCLVIKIYVGAIAISNFKKINLTELKDIIGPQGQEILGPLFPNPQPQEFKEASVEEELPLPQVFRNEKKDIFFDIWVLKGKENRLMVDQKLQLCASILSPQEVKNSRDLELSRFISNILQVRRDDIEIILSEANNMSRRVVIKARAITEKECQQRLHANMQSFTLDFQEEMGAEESAKLDKLFFHTEIKSKQSAGPAPEESEEDHQDCKPNYIKNPTMLDKVLRDLMPNQEIIIRGRLLKKSRPNFIARPLLENYQGQRSLKVRRKILEGCPNEDKERRKNLPAEPRMRCPDRIRGLSVIDILSEDGSRVISRRVFTPLFQNRTHDFVDELDYTEIDFKTSP